MIHYSDFFSIHIFFSPRLSESAPICLPAGNVFPDLPKTNFEDKIAVVVGMGSKWDKYETCQTEMGGPSPFQNCKFPFYGPKSTSGNGSYDPHYFGCVRSIPTPSSKSFLCKKFHMDVSK